ncbi:MAG: carbohydrate ABC transporter permease [Butyrivibrio sp.]|jgi:putative aldouronate transport system permease protein
MAKMSEKMKQELKAEKAYNKKHKRMYRLTANDVIFNIFAYLLFGIFVIICIFPFYYIFINSISSPAAVTSKAVTFWPQGFSLETYKAVIEVKDIGQAFLITITRTILATALMVLASGIIGYLVTKQEMWHRKLWYRLLVVTMYFNAGIIPWYLNMAMLGLTNNYMAYIVPAIVAPYNIILVKTYIESIPAEMEESAFIDGAGYAVIFRKIIWPLSKPILATITIFGAVGNWNSFTDSLMLMQSKPQLQTLQHKLYNYLDSASDLKALIDNPDSAIIRHAMDNAAFASVIKYTVSMISIIPILIVYPFMQRYFEEGIMLGAVKG